MGAVRAETEQTEPALTTDCQRTGERQQHAGVMAVAVRGSGAEGEGEREKGNEANVINGL